MPNSLTIGANVATAVYAGANILSSAYAGSSLVDLSQIHADATAYQTRVATASGSVSATDLTRLSNIYLAIEEVGTLESGWLFGDAWNATMSEQVNLVAGQPSLVPIGTQHVDSNLAPGMLHLRLSTTGNGWETADDSGLLDIPASGQKWSMLIIAQYFGDTNTATTSSQHSPWIFSQASSTGSNGNVAMLGSTQGGLQFVEWGSNGLAGGDVTGNRDKACEPILMWWTCDDAGNTRIYHAGDETDFIAADVMQADPSAHTFQIGEGIGGIASTNAGNLGIAAVLKIGGDLSDANRMSVYNTFMENWRLVGLPTHITGNSVTDASSVDGSLNRMDVMPRQVAKWGLQHGMLTLRIADGSKRLPYYAPTGYTQPVGTVNEPDIAVRPINNYTWLQARIWINHEQQNYAAYNAGTVDGPVSWSAWKHCHDAIAQHLIDNGSPDLKCVVYTQMPMAAWETLLPGFTNAGEAFVYSDFASSPGRSNLLAITDGMKAESSWICDTEVADLYYTRQVSGGWTGEATPNLPRGDDSYFHSNADRVPPVGTDPYPGVDPQHSNKSGHDQETTLGTTALTTLLGL